jgi:hypothetical protein
MNKQLKEKLAGRAPLVIAVEGLPTEEQSAYIVQLGIPCKGNNSSRWHCGTNERNRHQVDAEGGSFPRCQAD